MSWRDQAVIGSEHFLPAPQPHGLPGRGARTKKRRTLTASQLKERGWTDGLILSVLGEPDKRRKKPNHPTAARLCLYFLDRVRDAEQQPSVCERLQRIAELRPQRSATAKETARSRQRNQARAESGRQPRPRFNAEDYRRAEAWSRHFGNDEVARRRALTERDSRLDRARIEAARRNRAAAEDHRRVAERLNRASELLERRRGRPDDGGRQPER